MSNYCHLGEQQDDSGKPKSLGTGVKFMPDVEKSTKQKCVRKTHYRVVFSSKLTTLPRHEGGYIL